MLRFTLILLLLCTALFAEDAKPATTWGTDLPAALTRAKEEHRLVLVHFSGSDWNPWCRLLQAEVFSRKPFLEYAQSNLVLVVVDFPRGKTLPPDLATQNASLLSQYSVTFYPTVLVLEADGLEHGRIGYIQGGAKTFVRELKRLADLKPRRP